MGQPLFDPNTSDLEFAADTPMPLPSTWYNYGVTDGQEGFVKRALPAPWDVFQQAYDDGFDHGAYMKTYLVDPRP